MLVTSVAIDRHAGLMVTAMRQISSAPHPVEINNPSLEEVVTRQMERVLAHPVFFKSPRLSQLFRYTVEMTIAGKAQCLKEYTIAVDVFNRPETFDCRLDSIVRVEGARLRKKLELFYRTAGAEDKIVLTLPPSGYEPVLYIRELSRVGLPVVALVGEESSRSKAWSKSFSDNHVKFVHFSRSSLESFDGTFDLVIVLMGVSDKHSSFEWVLEATSNGAAAILFVPWAQSKECAQALRGAIKALVAENNHNVPLGRLLLPRHRPHSAAAAAGD